MRLARLFKYFAGNKFRTSATSTKNFHNLDMVKKTESRLRKAIQFAVSSQKSRQRETSFKKAHSREMHDIPSILYQPKPISKQLMSKDIGYGLLEHGIVLVPKPPYYATGYY